MEIIQNNPYRILGILVGATAAEQRRQLTRLQRFLDAEQEPEEDFSFPTLGQIHRTVETVNEASSKLTLDSDKIIAALFWFFNGNPITDEPAFDALKEADLDQVLNIWTKLISNGEINHRNASAYSNLGTFYLSGILEGTNTNEALFEQGISLKLKFIESDFIKNFLVLTTDETFKMTKIELQLIFLKQVQNEIEKNKNGSLHKFIDILKKHEFLAKEDFYISFVQKPIEEIEKKIEDAKSKRKASIVNAINIGEELQKLTADNLSKIKAIFGFSNIKYSSIADKVANEILQCSIDYFNHYQEKESDINYFESAFKLAKSTELIAVGKLTKDRIIDTLNTLEEMKDKEISQAIQVLQSIKEAYETNKKKITAEVNTMPLGYNQSINWSMVNQMIENSINWDNAIELVHQVIPQKNIEKIKSEKDQTKLKNFKSLVNFLISKLNNKQIHKVKYLCFWKTENTVLNIFFKIKLLPLWVKWCLGIALIILIVGLFWGEEGLQIVLGIAGFFGILFIIGLLKSL